MGRTAGLAHHCSAGTAGSVGVQRDHEDSPLSLHLLAGFWPFRPEPLGYPTVMAADSQDFEQFLLKRFHKPGQGTFGAICPAWKDSIAMDASRSQLYVLAAKFYLS